MSVILTETHVTVVKKVRRKYRILLLALCLILCCSLVWNVLSGIHQRLMHESYSMAQAEYSRVLAKHKIVSLLRSKPLTAGQAIDMAEVISEQRTIPLSIVLAILEQESEFNTNAVSIKGARGIMQVMPEIWNAYAGHPLLRGERQMHNPVMNVRVGLLFLGDLYEKYGDWSKVLRAYQAGESNVENREFDWYVNQVMAKAAVYSPD